MSSTFRAICSGRFVFGVLVVAIGVLFTLDNLDIVHAEQYFRFWPVALVLLGLTHFVPPADAGRRMWGLIWVFAGVWLTLENLDLVDVSLWALWPLLLVLLGATMIWRAMAPRARPRAPASDSDDFVRATAVMSGVNRVNASSDFRGADLTAVMGGCEVDLRQAAIAGGEAVVDVFAVWGGIELKVPEHWVVVNQVVPILGGVDQKSRASNPDGPRLLVRGTVVMGGVDIDN
jgi:predicted membrane protein